MYKSRQFLLIAGCNAVLKETLDWCKANFEDGSFTLIKSQFYGSPVMDSGNPVVSVGQIHFEYEADFMLYKLTHND